MTDEEKEPYVKAYEIEKEQYDLENQEYLKAIGQIGEDRRKKSTKRKYFVHEPKHPHKFEKKEKEEEGEEEKQKQEEKKLKDYEEEKEEEEAKKVDIYLLETN